MELMDIITLVLSGTSVAGIVSAIVYRRQNKKLKENEVKKDDANTQAEQINLGDLFMQKSAEMFQKMQELQEQTYQATLKNGADNDNILQKIDEMAEEQKHIIMYLNGDYQAFLERNGFKG